MSFKTALIDGDLLFYAIAAAAEYGVDPETIDMNEVYHSMEVRAANVTADAGCLKRRIFLTGSNFRYFIASDYKGNRKETWRPSILPQVRSFAELFMGAEVIEGLEADDAMAMFQAPDTVICTIDKDLLQVPGLHFQWEHSGKEAQLILQDSQTAMNRLYIQLLTGDSTDNIMGCGIKQTMVYKTGAKAGQEYEKRVGIGPKKAEQLLAECHTEEEKQALCLAEYNKVFGEGKGLMKMIQAARLVHMVREMDGDYIKLWTPIGMEDCWMNRKTGEMKLDG